MDGLTKTLNVDDRTAVKLGFDPLIKCAVNTITVPASDSAPWLQSQLSETLSAIETLEKEGAKRTFGVFNHKKAVEPILKELRAFEMHLRMALVGYPALLNPTVLSWHQPGFDWPAFQILSLDNPVTTLRAIGRYRDFIRIHEPEIPGFMMNQLERAYNYLAFGFPSFGDASAFISSEFVGTAPDATLERILEAQASQLFDRIYLLAEVEKPWVLQGTISSGLDPIVFGVREDTEQMFVIDIFNPSYLEMLVFNSRTIRP